MALPGYVTPQELKEASIDADTLDRYANGPAGTPNINRAGNDVGTIADINADAAEAIALVDARFPGKGYPMLAVMQSDLSPSEGTLATVANDTTVGNNGLYRKVGVPGSGSWARADYDPASIGRRNGYVLTGQVTEQIYDSITRDWIISHPELRLDLGAGRSFVLIAAQTLLRIPAARVYYVDLTGATGGATLTGAVSDVDPAASGSGFGAFVDDLRLPLFYNRAASANNRRYGGLLESRYRPERNRYGDVWMKVTPGSVTFDKSTLTLSATCRLLCPAPTPGGGNRILLERNWSYTFSGNAYEVAYLDLADLPRGQDITPITAIKGGIYSDNPDADRYLGRESQLPLFFYSSPDDFGPVGSFPVTVSNSGPLPSAGASLNMAVSQEADQKVIYLKGSSPNSNRYVSLNLRHMQAPYSGATPSTNMDLWRIVGGHECERVDAESSFSFTPLRQIINNGEWECALRVRGTPDHVGGFHGFERLIEAHLLVDGVAVDLAAAGVLSVARTLIFMQTSEIFMHGTEADVIADHVKRLEFFEDGRLEITQEVTWRQVVELSSAYLAMLPIKRFEDDVSVGQITSAATRDPGYTIEDVSADGFTEVVTADTLRANIWGPTGIGAQVELLDSPALPGQNYRIKAAPQYNKMYFDLSGTGYFTEVGEHWKTKARYRLNTTN